MAKHDSIMDAEQSVAVGNEENVILLNTFTIRKKRFRVFYNAGKLVWERYQSKKGNYCFCCCPPDTGWLASVKPQQLTQLSFPERMSIPVSDVLAITPKLSEIDADDETSEKQRKSLTIIYAKRSQTSTDQNKWRHYNVTFGSSDYRLIKLWARTLHQAVNGKEWWISICGGLLCRSVENKTKQYLKNCWFDVDDDRCCCQVIPNMSPWCGKYH